MRIKFLFFLPVVAMLTLGSCGDNSSSNGAGPGDGENREEQIDYSATVESTKKSLTATANRLNTIFKPEDQKEVIDLIEDFADLYGDLDAPAEFDAPAYSPAGFFKAMRGAVKGNSAMMMRAATYYSNVYKFSDYAGIYTPGRYAWVRSGSSSDIIFRFQDSKGVSCEMKVTSSGSTTNIKYDDYDESYEIRVPNNVKATLTRGSKTLIAADTKTAWTENVSFSIDASLQFANINWSAVTSGTNRSATLSTLMSVSGTEVVKGSADVNGNNLCKFEKYDTVDYFDQILSGGTATVKLLDQELRGKFTTSRELTKTLDSDLYYDEWDVRYNGMTKEECRKEIEKAINVINRHFSCGLYSDGSKRADLQAGLSYDEWDSYYGDGFYYEVIPVVCFPDGTTYDMDEFGESMGSVVDQLDTLIEAYDRVFGK